MQNLTERLQNHFTLNCNGRLISLEEPRIMGILNLTPDSFSDGGKFFNENSALAQTEKMVSEGATIIDVGAQSTRPGATLLDAATEVGRLGKMISLIKKNYPGTLISIDTFYAETVRFAASEGADIINDISGGQFDPQLPATAAETGLSYVLMHNRSSYADMHHKAAATDITLHLNRWFSAKIAQFLEIGVKDIILDPGFGFGKTVKAQHTLLNEINFIGWGRFPLLIGISRKSFIYKPLGKTALNINEETQKLHLKALQNGAKILRVHDVAAAAATVKDYLSAPK